MKQFCKNDQYALCFAVFGLWLLTLFEVKSSVHISFFSVWGVRMEKNHYKTWGGEKTSVRHMFFSIWGVRMEKKHDKTLGFSLFLLFRRSTNISTPYVFQYSGSSYGEKT